MKPKMIIKFNKFISYEDALRNDDGMILLHPDIDIQAIILEDEQGEIKVINLKDGSIKNRKNILEKIKKLFKK